MAEVRVTPQAVQAAALAIAERVSIPQLAHWYRGDAEAALAAAAPLLCQPLQDENERLRAIVEAVRALAEPKLPGNGPIPAAMILRALRGKSVYAEDLHAALTAGQGGEL